MNRFEFEACLNETRLEAHKAREVANAFMHEYVEIADNHLIAKMIEYNPDSYTYLFLSVYDYLHELCKKLDQLEAG